MQIPTSRMCSTLYSTCVLLFDNGFLHDPVSILHPFTIFKWFLCTLVHAVFPFITKRLLETVAGIGFHCSVKEHDQIL